MFGFFYPRQVLDVGVILLVVFAIYESFVIWRRRHPARNKTRRRLRYRWCVFAYSMRNFGVAGRLV